MKIGYACICLGDSCFRQRTCIQKFASEDNLKEIITWNLQSLRNILKYNVAHHIQMYRLSSDIIPFGSSPVNQVPWKTIYKEDFIEIGRYIKKHDLRVSMHPGQYTLLNALDEEIVKRSIADLQYHCAILDAMCLDSSHKMILHVGGIYGDKQQAIQRFIQVYQTLPFSIKQRLVIENDDRYYDIEDVLYISSLTQIPVIFDNLHHAIRAPDTNKTIQTWLYEVNQTWKKEDGVQKIHYSEQDFTRRLGAHARSINVDAFFSFVQALSFDIDIMIEVKDKNISALKAHYILDKEDITFYEEWNRYRYVFYLHSIAYYVKYEYEFEHHKALDRYDFYKMADTFLSSTVMKENYRSLFSFIKLQWYAKLQDRNQKLFDRYLEAFHKDKTSHANCIAGFYRIAQREQIQEGIDALLLLLEV